VRRALAATLCCLAASPAGGEVPLESPGLVASLPTPPRPHWILATDVLLRRSALLDLDSGAFLGMLSTGFLSQAAVFPRAGSEFYLPETYYSRGSRGERTDVLTIYDGASLAPVGEVVLPPRRAVNVLPSGNAAISDDDRFVAVFNMTPATSLSIVDLPRRALSAEIATPGCSLVYAAGARSFLMLCQDGALLAVEIDDAGRELRKTRVEPFFDPERDPVTEKAVRYRDLWLFVSFEGRVHPIDVSGALPRALPAWSLGGEGSDEPGWRIGGLQHLAVHQGSGRMFALMHQGGPDTHKEPGSELWVFDLESRERLSRIALRHPGISFLSETIEFGADRAWPLRRLWEFALDHLIPFPGIQQVQVTQDDAPLLATGAQFGGSLGVYDARSGDLLRRVPTGNLATHVLQAPWGPR
jgi:methylamine dehydrogenase heavy chain